MTGYTQPTNTNPVQPLGWAGFVPSGASVLARHAVSVRRYSAVMPAGRETIPAAVKRAVLVEASHRCALPGCRQIPVEIAHIAPYAETSDNSFENLIALCPTCHTRYDTGQIDRPSMRQYKANLSVVSDRYNDLERRVIEYFAERPDDNTIFLPGGLQLFFSYLVKDGLLEIMPKLVPSLGGSIFTHDEYHLTTAGRAFIEHLMANVPFETVYYPIRSAPESGGP